MFDELITLLNSGIVEDQRIWRAQWRARHEEQAMIQQLDAKLQEWKQSHAQWMERSNRFEVEALTLRTKVKSLHEEVAYLKEQWGESVTTSNMLNKQLVAIRAEKTALETQVATLERALSSAQAHITAIESSMESNRAHYTTARDLHITLSYARASQAGDAAIRHTLHALMANQSRIAPQDQRAREIDAFTKGFSAYVRGASIDTDPQWQGHMAEAILDRYPQD